MEAAGEHELQKVEERNRSQQDQTGEHEPQSQKCEMETKRNKEWGTRAPKSSNGKHESQKCNRNPKPKVGSTSPKKPTMGNTSPRRNEWGTRAPKEQIGRANKESKLGKHESQRNCEEGNLGITSPKSRKATISGDHEPQRREEPTGGSQKEPRGSTSP